MDIIEAFKARVEAAIEAHGLAPSAFGKKAVGDPSFVSRLRKRRNTPTLKTIENVEKFIRGLEAKPKSLRPKRRRAA